MRHGTFKRYWTYSVRTSLLLIVVSLLIFCGFIEYGNGDYVSSLFAPEVSQKGKPSPFFISNNAYYQDPEYFNSNDFTNVNVAEWQGFFDNKVTADDLNSLLYAPEGDTGYIDTLILYAKNAKYPINSYWRKNSINTVTDKTKKLEFLYYLGFAKRCEPYVTMPTGGWSENMKNEMVNDPHMAALVADAPQLLKSLKTPFIRQRLHFQVVRLLFISGKYADCSKYMYANSKEIDSAGTAVIKCRTWSYGALALYRQQEYAKANYLYARIFDERQDMQKTALFFFHPMNDSDWKQCLALAKTPHERAVMWTMTGLGQSDELTAIRHVYELEPSSPMLDILLTRLVNTSEAQYLSGKYGMLISPYGDNFDTTAVMSAESPEGYISTMMADTRLHNRPLWYLCEGYLMQIAGHREEAIRLYDEASAMAPTDSLLINQAHVLRIVASAELTKVLDAKRENEMLADLKWLGEPHDTVLRTLDAYNALRIQMSNLYTRQNNPVMAQLSRGFLSGMQVNIHDYYLSEANTSAMLAFMDRPDHSPMEDYLIKQYSIKKFEIIYFQGLNDVYNDHLLAARDKWKISWPNDEKLPADPFLIHISDYVLSDSQDPKVQYTRREFLDRMIDLEATAAKNKKRSAEAYLELANGFYNISYFGNDGDFYENRITGYVGHLYDFWDADHKRLKFAPDVLDCSMALKYYLKAREASSNKEFKAMCTFMAAKCEHNMGNNIIDNYGINYNPKADYGQYFKELKEKYSNTAYEKEVIRECGYFAHYLTISK